MIPRAAAAQLAILTGVPWRDWLVEKTIPDLYARVSCSELVADLFLSDGTCFIMVNSTATGSRIGVFGCRYQPGDFAP